MRAPLFTGYSILLATTLLPWCASAAPPALTTVAAVRAVSYEQAAKGLPVDVHGIVTYFDHALLNMYVQDATGSIYVRANHDYPVVEGSRVEIRGKTGAGYTTQIEPTTIREISRGPLPAPAFVDYAEAAEHKNDCRFVTMEGVVRSSTLQSVARVHVHLLQLEVAGHMVDAVISNDTRLNPARFLDATVRVTGNVGGNFDARDQILGLQIVSSRASQVVLVSPPATPFQRIPLISLDGLLRSDRAVRPMERIRTAGVLTLYDPGDDMVIEDGDDTLLIETRQMDAMPIGERVEVTGFPTAINGSPALELAQAFPQGGVTPLRERVVSFTEAMSGLYNDDLVALEGELVSETQESHLDTLTLRSGSRIFQAVYRKRPADPDPIPVYQPGTKLRVAGVCIVRIRGFWGSVGSFQVHMRTAEDIRVVAWPTWWTVRNLLFVTCGLLGAVLGVLGWGVWVRRRLNQNEKLLRQRVEAEGTRLETLARLERQRSHILELINSFEPLPRVFSEIYRFTADMWPGVKAYAHVLENRKLHMVDGAALSGSEAERLQEVDPGYSLEPCAVAVRKRTLVSVPGARPLWSRRLISSHGEVLGTMTFEGRIGESVSFNQAAFNFGCNLAAIAIDNRRLYEALLHRSEHDQLTGLPNRVLVEARLENALRVARESRGCVAILFLDLDEFKSVNDTYSHRVGDLYLCEAARRFQSCLRESDVLGRVGGDEFMAVITELTNPAQAREIASRILRAMQEPFVMNGITMRGSVSIGVAILERAGATASELKHQADEAMYASKRAGGNRISFA